MSDISKVVFGNDVLIDLTQDTVNANNMLAGTTAHGANGDPIVGNLITHNVIDNLTSTSTEDALSANQGRVLNTSKVNVSDIRNNLTSTDTNKPLSANQGRVLNEKIESATDTIEGISGGDEWLSTQDYSVNNYVIYQNKLYRCKANTTAGILPTNTTYWERVSISSLNESLTNSHVITSPEIIPINNLNPTYFSSDSYVSYAISGGIMQLKGKIKYIAFPQGTIDICTLPYTVAVGGFIQILSGNGESIDSMVYVDNATNILRQNRIISEKPQLNVFYYFSGTVTRRFS